MLTDAGGSLSSVEALDRMLHEIGSAVTAVQMCMPGNESSTGALRRLLSRRTYKRGDRLLQQGELHFRFLSEEDVVRRIDAEAFNILGSG